jgi:hypothetical protein
MSLIEKERLVHALVEAIEPGESARLASFRLARAVVSLVQDSTEHRAHVLALHLETIAPRYPRDTDYEPMGHDPEKETY